MNSILKTVLSLSFSGSLLILALLFCKPFYRKRLDRCWQYYIWLVVVARLLLPFTLETSLAGMLFQEQASSSVIQAEDSVIRVPVQEDKVQDSNTLPPQRESHQQNSEPLAAQFLWETLRPNLWLIWLCAALGLLLRKATVYQSFARYTKAGAIEISDPAQLNFLARLGESIGVKRPVELYENPLVSSPLLIGFFRPCIVLPSAALPEEDFRYTILHELTHYKRGDMFYKWLVQLAVCVHWFNPLVYRMAKEISRACELSCDEAVIRTLTPQQRRAYGDTLLNAAKRPEGCRDSLAAITLHESAEQLKERLSAIMSYQKKSKWTAAVSLLLAVLAAASGAAAGAYSPPSISAETESRGVMRSEVNLPTYTAKDGNSNGAIGIVGVESNTDLPSQDLNEGDSSGMVRLLGYNFTRNGYYHAPYMFEIGYNLQASGKKDYSHKTLTVSGSPMLVYYLDSCRTAINGEKTVQALEAVLSRIQAENAETDYPLVCPLVYSIENTGTKTPAELAERYYNEGLLPQFEAVFALLNQDAQQNWLTKIMDDGNIAFFSIAIQSLPENSPLASALAEQAYENGDIASFSVALQNAVEAELEAWLTRAMKDGMAAFQAMLLQNLGWDEAYDSWKEELDQKSLEEYRAHGITGDRSAFYYQGQRVRILLDQREDDLSCITLQMDPEGSLDIKILRNANNEIRTVSRMTAEEAAELLGDWEDDSDEWDGEDWEDELPCQRLVLEEAPQQVQLLAKSCKPDTWYRFQAEGYQFVYYNGLPGGYSWNPVPSGGGLSLHIQDMGTGKDGYALFRVPGGIALNVFYNGKPVSLSEPEASSPSTGSTDVPSYEPDENKTITIPFFIPSIEAKKAVCIAAIPNITNQNGKSWTYNVTAKDIRGLFVGMAYDSGRTGRSGTWYNYCGGNDNEKGFFSNLFPSTRLTCHGTEFGSNTTSGDRFYIYVGSESQALEDIQGTITIQYK